MSKPEPIRILQVGDVHFPAAVRRRHSADLKRDAFSMSDEIAPEGLRLKRVIAQLSAYETGYFDAIAFMGDFTDGHPDVALQMEGMDKCFAYIELNIIKPLLGRDGHAKSLFVPGNHDVDRTVCPTEPGNRMDKFAHYVKGLSALGYVRHSADQISELNLRKGPMSAFLAGINTCLGCGEFMTFPQKVKDDLLAQLSGVIERGRGDAAANILETFLDLTERLDAPLIEGNILQMLDSSLDRRIADDRNAVQVVIGHHNLLPQVIPRVAPFSELMNSGKLRSLLATKDTPVLYLHGHIHDHPVEVVYSQTHPDSCVISVSAPEFIDGFNVIEIHADEDGAPLGVVVNTISQTDFGAT